MFALDPDYLRTFIAISETGSYGAAGERVNKTQSTVSAQMKRLEEILGVPLFEKEGRRNVLTAEGRKLLEYAASMVRLNDQAVNAFRPPEVSGSIRVGAIDEYAQAFFPEVLASFARSHPSVQVEILTGTSPRLRGQIESAELDAAIVSLRAGDTETEILRSDRLHWIGAAGACVHFEDPLPFTAWAEGCSWRDMALASLAGVGRSWRLTVSTSNSALLSRMVRDGMGVTVAPAWFVSEGLCVLEDLDAQFPLGTVDVGVMRRNSLDDPALDAFVGHLKGQIARAVFAA